MHVIQDWGDPVEDRRQWRRRLTELRAELAELSESDPRRADVLAKIDEAQRTLDNLPPDVVNS